MSMPPRAAAKKVAGPHPMLVELGGRVRAERELNGMTQLEVAERAGVSLRFVAMLEAGSANVAVLNLQAVATRLGTSAAKLLEGCEKHLPRPPLPNYPRKYQRAWNARRICLLGLRGAGKSTIGARVARELDVPFIELDARIVERAGMSLGGIFDLYGQAGFRKLEREELERVLHETRDFVLAPSGSIVTEFATFELLRQQTNTVWLRASATDHWRRVIAQGDSRPMADRKDAKAELRSLLGARRALYERASHVVDTSRLDEDRAVARIVRLARRRAV